MIDWGKPTLSASSAVDIVNPKLSGKVMMPARVSCYQFNPHDAWYLSGEADIASDGTFTVDLEDATRLNILLVTTKDYVPFGRPGTPSWGQGTHQLPPVGFEAGVLSVEKQPA